MPARKSDNLAILIIDRLPRTIVCCVMLLACAVTCSLGMAARRPFILASSVRAENELLARRYMMQRYETQRLEREVAEIQTPAGLERQARSRGYLGPNERRLTFLP